MLLNEERLFAFFFFFDCSCQDCQYSKVPCDFIIDTETIGDIFDVQSFPAGQKTLAALIMRHLAREILDNQCPC